LYGQRRRVAVWGPLIVFSLASGILRGPWWTMLPWPVICLAIGVWLVIDESPTYDMPGFGYYVGTGAAIICVLAALLGRGIAVGLQPRGRHRDRDAAGDQDEYV
jgi:hypothetical protein